MIIISGVISRLFTNPKKNIEIVGGRKGEIDGERKREHANKERTTRDDTETKTKRKTLAERRWKR